MNEPHIPYRHFWNPKGKRPKPPVSRLRQMQLEQLGIEHDTGLSKLIRERRRR